MATQTANDLIQLAAKGAGILGAGQTLSGEDVTDCFDLLNLMLDRWQHQRWMVYHLVTNSVTSTGAQSYTVGPTGDINIPRPDHLESAFFRRTDIEGLLPDWPLEIIKAREDYNRIRLKELNAFPQFIFYDSDYPMGTIYPWPIPKAGIYQIFITTKAQLSDFTALADEVTLPRGYKSALVSSLACDIRDYFGMAPKESMMRAAKKARSVIRGENSQIPRLRMPRDMLSGGRYDIYSDRGR